MVCSINLADAITSNIDISHIWSAGNEAENHFVWASSARPVDQYFNGWMPGLGEPNGGLQENCLEMYHIDNNILKWNDISCDEKLPFFYMF